MTTCSSNGSKIRIAIAAVMLSAAAYGQTKTTKKNEPILLKIHRTGCYGRCPEYTITIAKNGLATYTTVANIKDSDTFKKTIGRTATKKLFSRIAAWRLDTCRNMYDNPLPDASGMTITVQYTNSTKQIFDAGYGPPVLQKAIKAMMALTGTTPGPGWRKTK